MKWGAVIVAAGRGTRFGGPKQLIALRGFPLVGWSLRTFAAMPEIEQYAIVTEEAWLERMSALATEVLGSRDARVVGGGATRQESVWNGVRALDDSIEAVFVHDGARPLVRADDVRAGMNEVRAGRGALLAVPVVDTIKVVDASTRAVRATPNRGELWAAQTPQFAMRSDLLRAHERAVQSGMEATDDAALLEWIGVEVVVVPSTGENFKITLPHDLARAEAMLE